MSDGLSSIVSLAVHADLPFNPHFVYGTSGSGSLTTTICWIDFIARAASLDTSEPNGTAAPTPPFFKSKESAQKKRRNSTWERFAIPPHLDPQILIFLALTACSIRLQGQEGAPGNKGPSYLGVRVSRFLPHISRISEREYQSCHPPSWQLWCCEGKIQEQPSTTRFWCQCSCGTSAYYRFSSKPFLLRESQMLYPSTI